MARQTKLTVNRDKLIKMEVDMPSFLTKHTEKKSNLK